MATRTSVIFNFERRFFVCTLSAFIAIFFYSIYENTLNDLKLIEKLNSLVNFDVALNKGW